MFWKRLKLTEKLINDALEHKQNRDKTTAINGQTEMKVAVFPYDNFEYMEIKSLVKELV